MKVTVYLDVDEHGGVLINATTPAYPTITPPSKNRGYTRYVFELEVHCAALDGDAPLTSGPELKQVDLGMNADQYDGGYGTPPTAP